MGPGEIAALATAIVALIGAGTTLIKSKSESRHVAVQAAHDALEMLKETYGDKVEQLEETVKKQDGRLLQQEVELEEQRCRRHDLEARVLKLERWIRENTNTDPNSINGEKVQGTPF